MRTLLYIVASFISTGILFTLAALAILPTAFLVSMADKMGTNKQTPRKKKNVV